MCPRVVCGMASSKITDKFYMLGSEFVKKAWRFSSDLEDYSRERVEPKILVMFPVVQKRPAIRPILTLPAIVS